MRQMLCLRQAGRSAWRCPAARPFARSLGCAHWSSAGGGAKNPVWTAIRQRELGVPVVRSERAEAAYGAAILARQGAYSASSPRREAHVSEV